MTHNGSVAGHSSGRRREELKIVIVGDGGCGKTSLLMVYSKGDFPEKYAPSVFEKYITTVKYGSREIILNLYDTAGGGGRTIGGEVTVSLVEKLVAQSSSTPSHSVLLQPAVSAAEDVWYPEVNHFCRGVPTILIGCKTDLRKDKERTRKLRALGQTPITYIQGEETKRQINADLYLECSAKYRENVEDIFREATKRALAGIRRARQPRKRSGSCALL
ncbi:hypothetical protein JZ751_001413 [Albula glossodonta]|uniref:Uncharacterized protein n=1 Tax=Albula glossodonta TaxID=121402 RepID=A0A8T2PTM1_9TELE|nr:hypothetical protein JZ751_001413 [Albula glossodonta]